MQFGGIRLHIHSETGDDFDVAFAVCLAARFVHNKVLIIFGRIEPPAEGKSAIVGDDGVQRLLAFFSPNNQVLVHSVKAVLHRIVGDVSFAEESCAFCGIVQQRIHRQTFVHRIYHDGILANEAESEADGTKELVAFFRADLMSVEFGCDIVPTGSGVGVCRLCIAVEGFGSIAEIPVHARNIIVTDIGIKLHYFIDTELGVADISVREDLSIHIDTLLHSS